MVLMSELSGHTAALTLRGTAARLRKILVSTPANSTTPSTHSVFLRVQPLSIKFAASRRCVSPFSMATTPSNSYNLHYVGHMLK